MTHPKIIALLPMRVGSERVVKKNVRAFAGKPLYHHILGSLLEVSMIEKIVIDTDDAEIASVAPTLSGRVQIIARPEHLCSGDTPMNEVLLYDVEQLSADYFLQTHSTNPLLKSETIANAIAVFLSNPQADSLFGVTRIQTRLWTREAKAINHDPDILLRTQDLEPVYDENSNIYIFKGETLKARRNRIGRRPMLFEIPRDEAWDIDEEVDFRIAEALMKERIARGEGP